jgi:endogenous inhibitor of DNA gyrase (YacG/DUF329 family)
MKTTVDEEQVIRERYGYNQEQAKSVEAYKTIVLLPEARRTAYAAHRFQCLVCGQPMEVKRRSKSTCSARCRLKLSRWMRAYLALPKNEIRKRETELNKRWRRQWRQEQGKAKAEEKRQSVAPVLSVSSENVDVTAHVRRCPRHASMTH